MVGRGLCGGLAEWKALVTWLKRLACSLRLHVVLRRTERCSLLPRKAVWASVGAVTDRQGTQRQCHSLCQSCGHPLVVSGAGQIVLRSPGLVSEAMLCPVVARSLDLRRTCCPSRIKPQKKPRGRIHLL